ncbi:MAG: DUF975 family protein [Desulfuromonadaceae bacterium]|nr:DUF975 family protein [Desulfuromonadaceae bacterium]MDD2848038.1 DUF975 family protein [Desulfuromonadaceae bacterium]MDD4132121.1 DUF975 family protein [Desulfuromonadaceae bacterium]
MSNISIIDNKILMAQARESLKGNWGLVTGTTVLFIIISGVVQCIPLLGGFIGFAINGPLSLGLATLYLSIIRNKEAKSSQLFDGFNRFGVSLGAYLLALLFCVLWALLLIVPGIIASLSYSMMYYIIADDRNIGPLEAISKSKAIMYGNKWKLACLNARFIGWSILCIFTLGIGFIWLLPYIATSNAKFYEEIISGDISTSPFTADIMLGNSVAEAS